MGKNRTKEISTDWNNEKTQKLEETKRISKGIGNINQPKKK